MSFLGLECGSSLAVYGGSESSRISSKIVVFQRQTKVLRVWNNMRVRQYFHLWVNYSLNTSLMKRYDTFISFNECIKLELNQFDEQI